MKGVFSYTLPEGLIAQYPLPERDKARLMVVDRKKGSIEHAIFCQLSDYLQKGDLLVLNDARVIPARLRARKTTGGKLEVFLLKKREPKIWEVLLRGRAREGQEFSIGKLKGRVIQKTDCGFWLVELEVDKESSLYQLGEIPLPPYIKRPAEEKDRYDYQTVYASKNGAVAAPTAGLHFTGELLVHLQKQGIGICFLTLYIGWASFRLLKKEEKNEVPGETFHIPEETAATINLVRKKGGRIIAVGTSTVRALESSVVSGEIVAGQKETFLFIQPGFNFSVVNGLITNFHLPGSTHLTLVCAFGGSNLLEKAYQEAVENRYRFYSYGDAMLIL